jgi:alanyl-tRNA synthetase
MMAAQSKEIIATKTEIKGINFIMHVFTNKDPAVILYLCDLLKKQTASLFAFFISRSSDKDIFICYASDDIIQKGLSCDSFVKQFKDALNLRGGGRKNLVQGIIQGGFTKDYSDKVNECFNQFVNK